MQHKQGFYEKYVKRLIDIVCSLVVLVLFWWLYIILAILVRVKLGSPVLFKQQRPGKNERIFNMYKFRTMTDARDEKGELLPDDVRLTKFGKALRATSLDELPELWNIFKGDMSIVGPRPERVENVEAYSQELPEWHYRERVKAGLTGYAQIFGKYNTTAEDKLRLDLIYIEKYSLLLDLKLIFMTGRILFSKESTEGFEVQEQMRQKRKKTLEELTRK